LYENSITVKSTKTLPFKSFRLKVVKTGTNAIVLKKQIAGCEASIKDATAALKDAGDREKDAQAQLDEANDIHSTPEVTAQLKQRILETQKALAAQTAEADKLESYEQDLRHSTRKKRAIFIAMAVAIVVIVLLILFFIVKPK